MQHRKFLERAVEVLTKDAREIAEKSKENALYSPYAMGVNRAMTVLLNLAVEIDFEECAEPTNIFTRLFGDLSPWSQTSVDKWIDSLKDEGGE